MMSLTHLTIGIAASLALAEPGNASLGLTAIAGGALGGVAPDIDILDNDYMGDALLGQLLSVGVVVAVVAADSFFGLGIVKEILEDKGVALVGCILYAILFIVGFISKHRAFTHSLLAMVLFSFAAALVYTPLCIYYTAVFFSHLLIDLLNKKGIQLLFPIRWKLCLGLCYANKTGNKVLMIIGLLASIFFAFVVFVL